MAITFQNIVTASADIHVDQQIAFTYAASRWDLLLAGIVTGDLHAVQTLAGWTALTPVDFGTTSFYPFYKVAGASEPGSYTFSIPWNLGSSVGAAGFLAAYRDVHTLAPLDTWASRVNGQSTSQPCSSLVTSYANDLIAILTGLWITTVATADLSTTQRGGIGKAGVDGDVSVMLSDFLQAAIGATPIKTATSLSSGSGVFTVALRPALPPTGNFSITYIPGDLNLSVNASGILAPPGMEISAYAWNWGDLTPGGSGLTAIHTYAAAGLYTITCTVTLNDGKTYSFTGDVNVTVPVPDPEPVPGGEEDERTMPLDFTPTGLDWLRLEQGLCRRAKNETGASIAKGKLVYISGFDATTGEPLITLASNAAQETLAQYVVLDTAGIANGKVGDIGYFGPLEELDTSGAGAAEDPIYLGTAGSFIYAAPAAPAITQYCGHVKAKHATRGKIMYNLVHEHTTGITAGALAAGFLSADATGRALMATDYFNAATILLKIADGAFAADAATRALFGNGIWTEAKLESAVTVGLQAARVAKAVFDPSLNAGERTQAAHTLAVTIPDNAIIIGGMVDVITTFTSASDAATIALHAEGANDLVSAIAISNGGNPWDIGLHATVPVFSAATSIKTTAARLITATVAGGENLTAGKLNVFLYYVVSD